jgi:hypothetical protein
MAAFQRTAKSEILGRARSETVQPKEREDKMKTFTSLIVISIIVISALLLTAPAVRAAAAEVWVIAIDRLDVQWNQPLFDSTYATTLATNPELGFWGYGTASAVTRAEAEHRVGDAIKLLCDHDSDYCAQVFLFKGLRWSNRQ